MTLLQAGVPHPPFFPSAGSIGLVRNTNGEQGLYFAIQGKDWKIPFIGNLADKIKI